MAFSEALKSKIKQFSISSLSHFRGALILLDKNVSGDTLLSLESRVEFGDNVTKIKYYGADTFFNRIYGRKEGNAPPLDPLIEWIEKRRLDINPYALQASIEMSGTVTPPVPYFPTVEDSLLPDYAEFFESEEVSSSIFEKLDSFISKNNKL